MLSYYTILYKIKNEQLVEEEEDERPDKIEVLPFCQSGDITGQQSLFFIFIKLYKKFYFSKSNTTSNETSAIYTQLYRQIY